MNENITNKIKKGKIKNKQRFSSIFAIILLPGIISLIGVAIIEEAIKRVSGKMKQEVKQ